MGTTELQSPSASADDATTLYWELDHLRVQLSAAAEDYGNTTGYAEHQDFWSWLTALPAALHDMSRTVAEVQAALAEVIVKTAGPATKQR
jgi:hypothetical protein